MFRTGKEELLHCCDRMALGRKTERMPTSQKDRLAAEAIDSGYDPHFESDEPPGL
jgi:hypothetical protein